VFLYADGMWPLGFIAFVPWFMSLERERTWRGALASVWAMSVAYTAAGFPWLAGAIGSYTGIGTPAAMAILLLAAPVLQPQFFAFALSRRWLAESGSRLRGAVPIAAWIATEGLLPRLLDDTWGYGLYPSQLLRQAADLAGVTGLTLLLLMANEGVARAFARRGTGVRAVALPLATAVLAPLLLAAYGFVVLSQPAPSGPSLRVGLVQSNITDYERLRREKGAGAVVREVLDTHFAMSYDAVERQHVDAVLWSETVYPTTFTHPKSEAGAEFDREILETVKAAAVPFVFGTYDRDAGGEYNAAAFVAPGTGLVGFYRKTRPFPLTEYVPPWLEGDTFRRMVPWAGRWQPGSGARVMPVRTRDGREVPVLPLICLDDVDVQLAVEGARLGAQAIFTMSNDSWFTAHPDGARLHLAAAALRSVETRLPQFRVTSNGLSAVIDATGTVTAASRMGERTLVIGELPVREPSPTLLVSWGDWLPRTAMGFLLAFAAAWLLRRLGRVSAASRAAPSPLPAQVSVLPTWARLVAAALRLVAGAGLIWTAATGLSGEGASPLNSLALLRGFLAFVVAPELAAWLLVRAFAATLRVESGELVARRGGQSLASPTQDIVAVEIWRLPLPRAGAFVRLGNGHAIGVALRDPRWLAAALHAAGAPLQAAAPGWAWTFADARAASPRSWLMHPAAKFVLLPLLLAIPAFRLHQHIAYGSSIGEVYAFGALAFAKGFAVWWASWAMAVVLCAAVLRVVVEAGTLGAVVSRPARALGVRRFLEHAALGVLYLGMPAWLLVRLLAG
jgi:apolipoprotein N-acyltransferase